MDAVHGADELHAREIAAAQLRRHGLQLRAVEHTHDGRLDHVAEVVAKGDLVAAELARLAVEIAAAHARAEVARRLLDAARDIENIRLKDRDRDVQQRCVALNLLPVDGVVAGVHDEINDLERHVAMPLQQLQELGHEHGVLAAGDAHRDPVAGGNEFVLLDGGDERRPEHLVEFFLDAALDQLIGFELSAHVDRSRL